MKEAQINQIIELLIDNTKDNSIVWKLSNAMFNSTRSHEFETFSMDNLTKFTMTLNLKDSFELSKGSLLCIYNDKLPDNLTIQQCGGMGIIASDLNASDLNSCMYSFESLTTNKQILKILIDLDSFYVDSLPADFEKSPRLKSHEIAKIIYDMIVLNNSI